MNDQSTFFLLRFLYVGKGIFISINLHKHVFQNFQTKKTLNHKNGM